MTDRQSETPSMDKVELLKICLSNTRGCLSDALAQFNETAEYVSNLEKELAALRKDAERYRWLRELPDPDTAAIYQASLCAPIAQGEILDAAIDEARKEQP